MFGKLRTFFHLTLLISLFVINAIIIFVTIKNPYCGMLLTYIIDLFIVYISMVFEEKQTMGNRNIKNERQKFWERPSVPIIISASVSLIIAGISFCDSQSQLKVAQDSLNAEKRARTADVSSIKESNDRSQANQFASWVSQSDQNISFTPTDSENGDYVTHKNDSGLPVYDVYFFLINGKSGKLSELKNINPQNIYYMRIVAPGEDSFKMITKQSENRNDVSYIFKDVTGKYFFRSFNGTLQTSTDLKRVYGIKSYTDLKTNYLKLSHRVYDGYTK